MYMCVRDSTVGKIIHPLWLQTFLNSLCNLQRDLPVFSEIRDIICPAVLSLWDYQRMPFYPGEHIKKGQKLVIFIDLIGRNLSFDDVIEYTALHSAMVADIMKLHKSRLLQLFSHL